MVPLMLQGKDSSVLVNLVASPQERPRVDHGIILHGFPPGTLGFKATQISWSL